MQNRNFNKLQISSFHLTSKEYFCNIPAVKLLFAYAGNYRIFCIKNRFCNKYIFFNCTLLYYVHLLNFNYTIKYHKSFMPVKKTVLLQGHLISVLLHFQL